MAASESGASRARRSIQGSSRSVTALLSASSTAQRAGMAAVDCARSVPKRPPWLVRVRVRLGVRVRVRVRVSRRVTVKWTEG